MFVIKICHSYEQFYITVTKKKLSYEMHQYDKQCLLLLQKFFISAKWGESGQADLPDLFVFLWPWW